MWQQLVCKKIFLLGVPHLIGMQHDTFANIAFAKTGKLFITFRLSHYGLQYSAFDTRAASAGGDQERWVSKCQK